MVEYICQVCGKSFNTKSGLSNHISQQPKTHPSLEDYYLKYILKHSTKTRKYNKKIQFIGIFTGYIKKRKKTTSEFVCRECNRTFKTPAALSIHIKNQYKKGNHISPEEYYLKHLGGVAGLCKKCGKDTEFVSISYGYKKFCNKDKNKCTCYICGKTFLNLFRLSIHIGRQSGKNMHPTPEEYYVKVMGNKEGVCKNCGRKTKFKNMAEGFYDFCSVMCMSLNEEIINKRKKTNMEKHGYENPFYSDEVQNNIKKMNMKKLGVEYPFQSEKFRKQTAKNFQDRLFRTISKYKK